MKVNKTLIMADIAGEHAVIHFIPVHIRETGDAQKIADEIQDIVLNYDMKVLVINFSRLKQLTSAFLSKLIVLNKSVREKGIQLRVCGMAPDVERGFRICKLQKVIRSFATEDEALAL